MSKFFSIWQRIMRSQNYNRTTLLLNLIVGFKKDILEAHAMQYAKRALSFNARDEVIKMITDAKNRQDDVTILSASIDPVVKAFSDILSVDYRCSTLKYNNNLATGALNFDMSGLKSRHVTNLTHTTMITDNFEDIEMQSKINEFYVVLNHPSHKKFWQAINNVKGFIS
jgi:phosphoserine phosphatase